VLPGLWQAKTAQPVGDFVADVQMRKDRIVLEHHVDRPMMRRHILHRLAIYDDVDRTKLVENVHCKVSSVVQPEGVRALLSVPGGSLAALPYRKS
jgi:hypothetical protein